MNQNERRPAERSDDDLVREITAGSRLAARELFIRYGSRLQRYAITLLGNPGDAEDLVQEAFVQAFSRLGQYRGPGTFQGWLFSICRNRALNDLRKRGMELLPFTPLDEGKLQPVADQEELFRSAEGDGGTLNLLGCLPPHFREVLLLRLVERLSYGEIAEMTGNSEENARQMVSRGLARLRKEVSKNAVHDV